jgi:hypothetical protein
MLHKVLERGRGLPSGSQFATPGWHTTLPANRGFESGSQTLGALEAREQFDTTRNLPRTA